MVKEIAGKHQVHPNQVITSRRQVVEGMADVSARGCRPERPTRVKVKEMHAKTGRLAVNKDLLAQGLKRSARQGNAQ